MYRVRIAVVPLLIVFVGACSMTDGRYVPVEEQSTSVDEQQQADMVRSDATSDPVVISSLPEPVINERQQTMQSPAVIALLDTADRELQSGRLEHAVASIERALNLQPKNAMLWSRLAIIRLQQQDWQQAYVLANKSNSLAQADRSLQIQNWQIIEKAKVGQGDNTGAAEARRIVENLR